MKQKFKELAHLSAIYLLGTVFEKILSFVLIPVYTSFLTTHDYGIIGMMSVTVGLVSPFIGSAINNGFLRHYHAPGFEKKNKIIFFNCLLSSIILSIFVAILFFLFSTYLSKILLGGEEFQPIVKIYSLIIIGNSINSLFQILVRIQKKVNLYIAMNITRFIFTAILVLYLLIFKEAGVYALVYGALFGPFYCIIFLLPFVMKNIQPKLNFAILKPLLAYGLPLIPTSFSHYLMDVGDRYILKILTTVSTVGLYSFGYQFAAIIQMIITIPIKYSLSPIVYEMEKNKKQLLEFLPRAATYYYVVATAVCLFLSLFCKELIQFIAQNNEFHSSWVIVPLIGFSYVLLGLRMFFNRGIDLAKKSYHVSAIYISSGFLNIVLNVILIPFFGIIGAAAATVISFITILIFSAYYSKKFYSLSFEIKKILLITSFGICLFLFSLLTINLILYLGLLVKAGIFIFFILLIYYFILKDEMKYIKIMLAARYKKIIWWDA